MKEFSPARTWHNLDDKSPSRQLWLSSARPGCRCPPHAIPMGHGPRRKS